MRASLPVAMVTLSCASQLFGCGALVTLQTLLDSDDPAWLDAGSPSLDAGSLVHDDGGRPRDGGAFDDGGPDDDGGLADGGSPPCGTVSMLADPLDVLAGGPFVGAAGGGASHQSTGGQLRLSIPSSADAFAGAGSRWRTSLAGDGVMLEVAALSQAIGVTTRLQLSEDIYPAANQAAVRLSYTGGTAYAAILDEDGAVTVAGAPMSTTTHRFWRIRAPDAERVILEVGDSAAGPFTELLEADAPPYLADAYVVFAAQSDGSNDAATIAFEEVSGLVDAPSWCPAADLVEDFSAPTLSRQWQIGEETECDVSLSGGRLRFTRTAIGYSHCAVGSSTPIALAGSSLQATIGDRPPTTGTFTGLHVSGGTDLGLWIGVREGNVVGTFEGTVGDTYVIVSSNQLPLASDPVLVRLLFDDTAQVAFFQHRDPTGSWITFWTYGPLPAFDDARAHLRMVNFAGANVPSGIGEIHDVNVVE